MLPEMPADGTRIGRHGGDALASAPKRDATTVLIICLRGGLLIARFLLALFIARFIGLEELGIYGLISGAAAVLQIVLRCGVFSKLSRDAVHNDLPALTNDLRHYGTGTLVLYGVLLPAAGAVGWYFGHAYLALLVVIVIMVEHAISDAVALMTNLDCPASANMIYAFQSAAWIYLYVAFALIFPALRRLDWLLAFWICGSLLALAFAAWLARAWPWADAFRKPLRWSWFKENVLASWRLYFSEVVAVFTLYIDRYLLSLFLTLDLVGVFVLFWQMASAVANLVGAGVLVVALQAIGVLAVAAVGGPAAGLHVGGRPRLRADRAQEGGRVEGARAHLQVQRLDQHAALLRPIGVELLDELLERRPGHAFVASRKLASIRA